jgi:uncharacterized membrane protein
MAPRTHTSIVAPLHILLLVILLAVVIGFVELGVLATAFDKLGLSAHSAYLLLMTTLAGSLINVPLFRIRSEPYPSGSIPARFREFLRLPRIAPEPGRTVIAVNVGGAVVPVCFCAYLIHHNPLSAVYLATCIAAVTLVAWLFSRPIRGLGIAIPILIAPITAAAIAYLVDRDQAAPLAYIGGTLGVLIGADLLRLPDIPRMGVPFASIGGAGSFDGIFITGLLAVLLS